MESEVFLQGVEMKDIIKISCEEVLKACLNKTKTTTARKAWNDTFQCFWCEDEVKWADTEEHQRCHPDLLIRSYSKKDKPCKYELGKEYDVVWTADKVPRSLWSLNPDSEGCPILGRVKVIRNEMIEIFTTQGYVVYTVLARKTIHDLRGLVKSEGFNDLETMVQFFKQYAHGITKPRSFRLTTWKWIE